MGCRSSVVTVLMLCLTPSSCDICMVLLVWKSYRIVKKGSVKFQVIPLAVSRYQFWFSSSAYKMDVRIKIMVVPSVKRKTLYTIQDLGWKMNLTLYDFLLEHLQIFLVSSDWEGLRDGYFFHRQRKETNYRLQKVSNEKSQANPWRKYEGGWSFSVYNSIPRLVLSLTSLIWT